MNGRNTSTGSSGPSSSSPAPAASAAGIERPACRQGQDVDAPAEILDLLSRQTGLYQRLHSLAARQRHAVRGDDPGAPNLLAVLADRQALTCELTEVSRRLGPYREQWAAVRNQMDEPQKRAADALLAESQSLLRGVLEGDDADARLLAAHKSRTAAELSSVHTARRMLTAYAVPAPTGAMHIDRTDEEA